MARNQRATKERVITGGDYVSRGKKILVAVGDTRKGWLDKVAELVGEDGTLTEVIKAAIDQALVEDPESFAVKVKKRRLKAQLEEIENAKKQLAEKEKQLMDELQQKPITTRRSEDRV